MESSLLGNSPRGAYASTAHNWLFIPYLETGASGERAGELNLINLILITLIATIAMHFLLRRKRIRKGGSHATSGWGLGLAVGGMFSIDASCTRSWPALTELPMY